MVENRHGNRTAAFCRRLASIKSCQHMFSLKRWNYESFLPILGGLRLTKCLKTSHLSFALFNDDLEACLLVQKLEKSARLYCATHLLQFSTIASSLFITNRVQTDTFFCLHWHFAKRCHTSSFVIDILNLLSNVKSRVFFNHFDLFYTSTLGQFLLRGGSFLARSKEKSKIINVPIWLFLWTRLMSSFKVDNFSAHSLDKNQTFAL